MARPRPLRRVPFAAAAVAVALVPALALADAAPSAPVSLRATVPAKAGPPTLVGASGQIYAPSGALRWQRVGAGGVAVDVLGAVRGGDGRLFAIGARTPLFVQRDGVWFAAPLANRGPVRAAPEVGAAAIDRHVYVLGEGGWRRTISARSPITALWGASRTRLYAATADGVLARTDGRRWHTLKNPLPADDPIVKLVGVPGRSLYALSAGGGILEVGGAAAVPLALPEPLAGLEVHAAGAVDGAVYLAGTAGTAERRGVLVRAEGRTLSLVDELFPLEEGDRYALIFAADGRVAIGSAAGRVRARDQEGGWVDGSIDGAPPSPPPEAGPDAAPARQR